MSEITLLKMKKMVNVNYRKGANRERRIKRALERKGFLCFRTAGSHSIFDIIALDLKQNIIHFIQVKPKSLSNKSKARLQSKISLVERNWLGKVHVISLAKEII